LVVCASATAQDGYATLVQMNSEIIELAEPDIVKGVPDLSSSAIAERREKLDEFRSRLLDIDTSSWAVPQQVDYLLVWSKMNDIVFQHRVMQPWARDPLTYLYQFRHIPHAEVPSTQESRKELTRDLQAVPRMVDSAIDNLKKPSAELADLAIFLLGNFDGVGQGEPYRDNPPEGTIGWFDDLCQRLDQSKDALTSDCRSARDAAQKYHDWLVDNIDGMASSAGIGTDNFNWYLKHVRLMPETVDDLRAIGVREFHRYRFDYILDRHKNASV